MKTNKQKSVTTNEVVTNSAEKDDCSLSRLDPLTSSLEPDEYIEKVGDCGLYQVRTQFLFLLFVIVLTAQIFTTYFVAHDPPWKCKQNSTKCNYTTPISSQDNQKFHKRCLMSRNEWEYTTSKEYSIVTQFDLICHQEVYATTAHSMVFIGMGVGGIFMAYLSDRYGRKTVVFPSTFVIIFCAIGSALANNLMLFIISRFIIGIAISGGVVFVIAAEISGPKYRALSSTMIWIHYSTAMVLLTAVSYMSQNWRVVEMAMSLPFLLLILTWSCFPESIRWLRVNGKVEEAEQLLHSIARINGKPVPKERLRGETRILKTATFLHLFYPLQMLVQTTIQGIAWFVTGLTYFAATFASQDLSGNFYTDFILVSVIEVPGNIAVIFFCNRIGRKKTVISHFYITAAASLLVAFVPYNARPGYKYIRLAAGILAKYAATCYFNSFYIWSVELNPTSIRAQAIGFLLALSRVGGSLAPMVITNLKYINATFPFLLMAVLNVIAGSLCLYLVETRNRPIADTKEQYLDSLKKKCQEKTDY